MTDPIRFAGYVVQQNLGADSLGYSLIAADETERPVLVRAFHGPGIDVEALWRSASERAEAVRAAAPAAAAVLGRDAGIPFLAYPGLRGRDLASVLAEARRHDLPLAADQALTAISDLARRVAGSSLTHGSIVPHLVVVDEDGGVHPLGYESGPELARQCTSGALADVLAPYLSPELRAGAAVGASDDVYAVAALLTELLTGIPPAPDLPGSLGRLRLVDGEPIPDDWLELLSRSAAPPADRIPDLGAWTEEFERLLFERYHRAAPRSLAALVAGLFDRGDAGADPAEPGADALWDDTPEPPTATAGAGGRDEGAGEHRPTGKPGEEAAGIAGFAGTETATAASAEDARAGEPAPTAEPTPPTDPPAADRRPRRRRQAVAAGLVALGVAAALSIVLQSDDRRPPSAARPAGEPAAVAGPAAAPMPPPAAPEPRSATAHGADPPQAFEPGSALRMAGGGAERSLDGPAAQRSPAPAPRPSAAAVPNGAPQPAPSTAPAAIRPEARPPRRPVLDAPAEAVHASSPPPAGPARAPAGDPAPPGATPPSETAETEPQMPRLDLPEVWVGELVEPGPGVTAPELRRMVRPRLPRSARGELPAPEVPVRVLVSEQGVALEAELAGAPVGHGVDEEALRVTRAARFEPARKNGVRVRMWTTVQVRFVD